jgi:hypothetical protein
MRANLQNWDALGCSRWGYPSERSPELAQNRQFFYPSGANLENSRYHAVISVGYG